MAYVAWSVTFGEQPSAAKWNILGTNDAFFDSLIGSGTALTTYSPSYANITVSNGTVVAKYQTLGKMTDVRWSLTCGSTTAIATGNTVSLPNTSAHENNTVIGEVFLFDTSTGNRYAGWAKQASTTTVAAEWTVAGSEPQVATVFPITEATGDVFSYVLRYENT